MSCVFCGIASASVPASIVAEDSAAIAFLDLRQFHAGHVLIISRLHVVDIRSADDETVEGVIRMVARISRAVDRAFPSDGVSVWHSAGEGANQEVPHLHFHVHPRRIHDDVLRVYPSPPTLPDRATLDEWAARLRRELNRPDTSIHHSADDAKR